MEPFAEVSCVLKVNVHCDACKRKMMEVLSSINGVYNVYIDAEEGMVKISGEVDPNILLNSLARAGRHAEVVWAKLTHPMLNRTHHDDRYNRGPYHGSYGYRRSTLPDHSSCPDSSTHHGYYHYPMMSRSEHDYPSNCYSNYYSTAALPHARYVPSNPPLTYDPYDHDPINLCSIM